MMLAGASALVMSLTAPMAIAQETDTSDDDGTRRLGSITVTATQREESIQDVPIAVTALDPETLERAGVADITSLDNVAPSFSMNTTDTESGGITLRLRGVGTTGNNIGLESSVAVFLDGVYLSRPGIALADLLDLEQLEVLRGPQGTLFGRNTSAGALNIKTKAPSFEGVEGFGNVTLGNYDLFNAQAGVNIPVIEDTLAFRLSGAVRQRGGVVSGLNGSESGTRDRVSLRAQALLDLKEAGNLRLIYDFAEGEDECCDAVWFNDFDAIRNSGAYAANGLDAVGGAPNVGDDAFDSYKSNSENFANPFVQSGFSAEYNVDLPVGAFTYIGSYRDYKADSFRNTDYTGLNIFTVGGSPEARGTGNFDPNSGTRILTQTHEARLQGSAMEDRLDWLVGAYYSDETIDSRGSLTLLDELQSGVSAGFLGQPVNALLAFSAGVPATGAFATNAFEQKGESMSIFTHNVFHVTDKLSLTGGLRYVEETKDGKFDQIGAENEACYSTFGNLANIPAALGGAAVAFNCFVFAAPAFDPNDPTDRLAGFNAFTAGTAANGLLALLPQEFDDTFEDEELVYTANAAYKINDNTNVYAGFSHGFKSGGFNLDASAAGGGADPRFDSEKVDAFEVGLKTDFWDGRARANIALFHQEMEDFQVLEFTGVRFQTFNVDKAISTGAEFEGLAQLTDNFVANLGVTYVDARYPGDCSTQDVTSPDYVQQAANLCGEKLTNAPELVTIVGGTYEQPVNNGSANFFISGSARNETKRRTSTQATELTSDTPLAGDFQKANTKVNLRIGLESEDERWGIELWGNNIFDERTKNVTFNIPLRTGARGQFVQDPATYGITVRTRF